MAEHTLCFVLCGILKLMHPFMPFITEEIYCALPTGEETIMTSEWPKYSDRLNFPEAREADVGYLRSDKEHPQYQNRNERCSVKKSKHDYRYR